MLGSYRTHLATSFGVVSFAWRSAISPLRSLMMSLYLETWLLTRTTLRTVFVLMFFARLAYFRVLWVSS